MYSQMKNLTFSFASLFLIGFLCACETKDKVHIETLAGVTMGTTYQIKMANPPETDFKELQNLIDQRLEKINQHTSTYIETSEISKFNRSKTEQSFKIQKDFEKPLKAALRLAHLTDGFYDPTIGPLVNLWGFGPNALKKKPRQSLISKTLQAVGYQKLTLVQNSKETYVAKLHPDIYVDLSSIAKGYAVDQLAELLVQNQIKNFLIEIGGELRSKGQKGAQPWIVAVEKPIKDNRAVFASFTLHNQSLATSGNYRNYFDEDGISFAHTIDPKTGYPAKSNLLSVSVIHTDCMLADGWATALMVLGEEKARSIIKKQNLNALLILREEDQQGLKLKTENYGIFKNLDMKQANTSTSGEKK